MAMLAGCGTGCPLLKPEPANVRQTDIESRYAAALAVYKQNMLPIAQYMVNVCGSMADREYIACIDAKREEISALAIYPDTLQSLSQRQALEQQLLNKAISRKEFRIKLEEAKSRKDAERLKEDIASGVYTGKY